MHNKSPETFRALLHNYCRILRSLSEQCDCFVDRLSFVFFKDLYDRINLERSTVRLGNKTLILAHSVDVVLIDVDHLLILQSRSVLLCDLHIHEFGIAVECILLALRDLDSDYDDKNSNDNSDKETAICITEYP